VRKYVVGKPEYKRPLGKPRCRWGGKFSMVSTELIWLRIGAVTGSCGYGNEFSVSVRGGKFLSSLEL
jgi:hypothetical protein